MVHRTPFVLILMFFLLPSGQAFAYDLSTQCKVTETSSDGSQTDISLKYEFTYSVGKYNEYKLIGSGWRLFIQSHSFMGDNDKIRFPGPQSESDYIDRHSGEIFLVGENAAGQQVSLYQGTCSPVP
jgi:hypothetical protein